MSSKNSENATSPSPSSGTRKSSLVMTAKTLTNEEMDQVRHTITIYPERLDQSVREYIGIIIAASQGALHAATSANTSDDELQQFVKSNVLLVVDRAKEAIQNPRSSIFSAVSVVPDLPKHFKKHGPVSFPILPHRSKKSSDEQATWSQATVDTSEYESDSDENADKNNSSEEIVPGGVNPEADTSQSDIHCEDSGENLVVRKLPRPAPFLCYRTPQDYSGIPPESFLPHYSKHRFHQKPRKMFTPFVPLSAPPPRIDDSDLEQCAYEKLTRYYTEHFLVLDSDDEDM